MVYLSLEKLPRYVFCEAGRSETRRDGSEAEGAALNLPRCESTNTKFCYYNNYSRAQPRHFCRACQRHWTVGGTLRNVPVGGGRKNKRQKTTHSTTPSAINPPVTINASVPLVGELEEAIFPDALRRVLLQPQAVDDGEEPFGNFLQNALPPFVTGFGGFVSGFDCAMGSTPFAAAASSCSSSSNYSCRRLVESATEANWVPQSLALPASYWDFWDGSADLNDAGQ
ncbi:hypothetical protein HPP92_014327 [Vanilla planifolia]|uniref:Dof zinc finger protein n=1 Tax=Vanilla planifolia TaxID=51239 RepID=A0A835UWS2_VANPL|nr:hypothetical protein HPP92_014327 [Vanilla planifolia]